MVIKDPELIILIIPSIRVRSCRFTGCEEGDRQREPLIYTLQSVRIAHHHINLHNGNAIADDQQTEVMLSTH